VEAIIFCGIQATGKSTFFKERFFKTHVHISLDLLKTRHREGRFLQTCIDTQQAFVLDNTNVSKVDREKYITLARTHQYKVIGYYFQSKLQEALQRNATREGKENIPEKGIKGTYNRLQLPDFTEGFDELYYVELNENEFMVKEWEEED
jgi:predicted kinase